MVLRGFMLPSITAADPPFDGEGGLDPLGLGSLADRLADGLTSPLVTARMRRVRFLTAIAAAAVVCEPLWDAPSPDGSPPYLAFEWLLVQALSAPGLPETATQSVPGIGKARAARTVGDVLDGPSYLKAPTFFGFTGVYRRLARGLGILDADSLLGPTGDGLLRAWEADEPATRAGFTDGRGETPGGDLNRGLRSAVARAHEAGGIRESQGSHLWAKLVSAFRPDAAGPGESRVLWQLLLDVSTTQTELLQFLDQQQDAHTNQVGELDVVADLRHGASSEMRAHIDAVLAYEALAAALYRAFQAIQWAATVKGTAPLAPAEAAALPRVIEAASVLPERAHAAVAALSPIGLAHELEDSLGATMCAEGPNDLAARLIDRHLVVQENKAKRPWFETWPEGVVLRAPYRLDQEPPDHVTGAQVHPYRVRTLTMFRDDLEVSR